MKRKLNIVIYLNPIGSKYFNMYAVLQKSLVEYFTVFASLRNLVFTQQHIQFLLAATAVGCTGLIGIQITDPRQTEKTFKDECKQCSGRARVPRIWGTWMRCEAWCCSLVLLPLLLCSFIHRLQETAIAIQSHPKLKNKDCDLTTLKATGFNGLTTGIKFLWPR